MDTKIKAKENLPNNNSTRKQTNKLPAIVIPYNSKVSKAKARMYEKLTGQSIPDNLVRQPKNKCEICGKNREETYYKYKNNVVCATCLAVFRYEIEKDKKAFTWEGTEHILTAKSEKCEGTIFRTKFGYWYNK